MEFVNDFVLNEEFDYTIALYKVFWNFHQNLVNKSGNLNDVNLPYLSQSGNNQVRLPAVRAAGPRVRKGITGMRKPRIPPILSDLLCETVSACDGVVFDRPGPCPCCGGRPSGYDTRKKQFAVILEHDRKRTVQVVVRRFSCPGCGTVWCADGAVLPGHPDRIARGGSLHNSRADDALHPRLHLSRRSGNCCRPLERAELCAGKPPPLPVHGDVRHPAPRFNGSALISCRCLDKGKTPGCGCNTRRM